MPQCKLPHPYSPDLNTFICILEKGHKELHLTHSFLGELYEWDNSAYEDRRIFFEVGRHRVEIFEILGYFHELEGLALVKCKNGVRVIWVSDIRIL